MFNSFIAGNRSAAPILLTLYNLAARIECKVLGNQARKSFKIESERKYFDYIKRKLGMANEDLKILNIYYLITRATTWIEDKDLDFSNSVPENYRPKTG